MVKQLGWSRDTMGPLPSTQHSLCPCCHELHCCDILSVTASLCCEWKMFCSAVFSYWLGAGEVALCRWNWGCPWLCWASLWNPAVAHQGSQAPQWLLNKPA